MEKVLEDLREHEDRAAKSLAAAAADGLDVATAMLQMMADAFGELGVYTSREERDSNVLLLAVLSRSFNSACAAMQLLLGGFYTQTVQITRHIEEDWLTCFQIKGNLKGSEAFRNALWDRKRPATDFQTMANQLGEAVGSWWRESYGPPAGARRGPPRTTRRKRRIPCAGRLAG